MDIDSVAIIGKGALGIMYADAIVRNVGPQAVAFAMDDGRFGRHDGETSHVNGEARVFRTLRAAQAAPVDLLVFAVKAPGLTEAIELAGPLVGEDTAIVSLLNGIASEERIAERYGWRNMVLCVPQGMDAVRRGVGDLTYTRMGELRFGVAPQAQGQTDPALVSRLTAFFERAGIPYVVEDDIRHRQWAKWMLNVGINQTCMVYGGTYGSALAEGEQNRTLVAAMREVIAVAHAEGVALAEDDLSGLLGVIAGLAPDGMPSMAQDRLASRPSEVEEFAGTLIRLADRHGILVPTNRWLYERVHQIEAAYQA